MSKTIERKVYASSASELANQTPDYRKSKPASEDLGIGTNNEGYSCEVLRSARAGSSGKVECVDDDGDLGWTYVGNDDAGLRPVLNLIFNPESPREARDPSPEEIKKLGKKVTANKKILDIPMADGTILPVQIENWEAVQNKTAKYYTVKTLFAVEATRFNEYKPNEVCTDYDGSDLDRNMNGFEEKLSPEFRKELLNVVMDKENNYGIIEVKTKEKKKATLNLGEHMDDLAMMVLTDKQKEYDEMKARHLAEEIKLKQEIADEFEPLK